MPGPLKQAIEAHTGPIESVRTASAGQNSPLAAIIDARDGKVFAEAGWNVFGYEYAPGRPANHSSGSPDLDRLVQLTEELSAIKVPDDPGPFKRAEDRWKPYLDDPETAAAFAGPGVLGTAPHGIRRPHCA